MSLIPPYKSFSFKSLNDLKKKTKELSLEIPFDSNTKILQTGIKVKNKIITNRLTIQPMEGFDYFKYQIGIPEPISHKPPPPKKFRFRLLFPSEKEKREKEFMEEDIFGGMIAFRKVKVLDPFEVIF